jgi:hypothetical protein
MLLRPSNVPVTLTFCLILAFVALTLYGTRTSNPNLPTLVKEVLPAGRCQCESSTVFKCDTCIECANRQLVSPHATKEEDTPWAFEYPRDANNYRLDQAQCKAAFPGLYEDIIRARDFRKSMGTNVTEQDLYSFELTKGMVRAAIFSGEVRPLRATTL